MHQHEGARTSKHRWDRPCVISHFKIRQKQKAAQKRTLDNGQRPDAASKNVHQQLCHTVTLNRTKAKGERSRCEITRAKEQDS